MDNKKEVVIRDAKSSDGDIAAGLIISAIEDLSNVFSGTDDNKATYQTFVKYFKEEYGKFSHSQGIAAEVDGKIVGLIMGYLWDDVKKLDMQVIDHVKKKYIKEPEKCSGYINQISGADEAFSGEYYIDNLAVLEDYRGLRISSLLIEEFERRAKKMGHEKVSILADVLNEKAYVIYKNKGYIKDSEKEVLGHRYHHLVKHT